MRRDSKINQFIPLHFYEPGEKLPDTDDWKIVIVKTYDKEKTDFRIAYYYETERKWYDDHLYPIERDDVVAWASFSSGWVTGSESFPEKWGSQ